MEKKSCIFRSRNSVFYFLLSFLFIGISSIYPINRVSAVSCSDNLFSVSSLNFSSNRTITLTNFNLSPGTYYFSYNLSSFSLGSVSTFSIYFQFRNTSNTTILDLPFLTLDSSSSVGSRSTVFTLLDSVSSANFRIAQSPYDSGARAVLSSLCLTPYSPYSSKFDALSTSIYCLSATILVVYFFYCIYRIIIKTTGGK